MIIDGIILNHSTNKNNFFKIFGDKNKIHPIINEKIDGVIVNPGAYTHTSVSLRDSLLLLSVPIIEVHISDIKERESFRKTNLINDICEKSFIGHGVNGYKMGIDYLNEK